MKFPLVLVVSLLILVGSDDVFADPEGQDIATTPKVGPLVAIVFVRQEPRETQVLSYGTQNGYISCPIKGIDLSNIQSVVWEFGNGTTNMGTFTWSPEEPSTATGSLKGKVNLEDPDHHLEFLSVDFDLSGFYKCIVNMPGKKPLASEPWELIVYEFADAPFSGNNHIPTVSISGSCEFMDSFSTPAIFPQPTITIGIYSKDQKEFVGPYGTPEIIQWPNGSYSYSFLEARFKITPSVPYNISLRREIGFTKKDGTYIALYTEERPLDDYGGIKGCPKLCHWDSNVVISYTNIYSNMYNNYTRDNCRGEMLPWYAYDPINATYSCRKGYRSTNNLVNKTEAFCAYSAEPVRNWNITGIQPIDFQCEPSPEQPSSSSCFYPSSVHIIYLILLYLCSY